MSTRDGHELFACTDTHYSTNVTPAIDPIDIVISSALNVLELRDITLARAEQRGRPGNRPEASRGGAQCVSISKQRRSIKRDPSDIANL